MLGLAGSSRAASGAVCTTSSNLTANPVVYASCVNESLLPHKANVGNDAQSSMKFKNEGGSTASHVSLQTAFSPGVTVKAIRLLKNGVQQSTSSCTPTTLPASNVTLVKCTDVANFASGDIGRLIVRFTSSAAATVTVTSSAFYAESGSDNSGGPNGTKNDNQTGQPDSVSFVASGAPASGGCTNAGGTFTDGDNTQSTQVVYNATSDSSLLCSPAGAAVIETVPAGLKTFVSIVEIGPQAGPGYAIAKIDFTPMPTDTKIKTIVLKESTALPGTADFSTWITVPDGCDANGLPPNPGLPEPGATDATVNHHNDSCITDRKPLPNGGGEITMHVIANPFDGKYGS